ncbi:MAG: hypothetical protein ACYTBJ_02220 [Planctomycetota bacterium]|jgi:protein-arginine kinase activator protein McsA
MKCSRCNITFVAERDSGMCATCEYTRRQRVRPVALRVAVGDGEHDVPEAGDFGDGTWEPGES